MLVGDNNYPALTTAAELIEPLLYLTTSQERQKLTDAPDPKRAVDKFWLDIAKGNQRQGKRTDPAFLRPGHGGQPAFFRPQSRLADRPGPAVRGAGAAAERAAAVQRRGTVVLPRGGQGGGPITYTFRPRPSTFAPDYYELVRRPEYELLWYAAVEKWRTPPTALTGPNAPTPCPPGSRPPLLRRRQPPRHPEAVPPRPRRR